jgi:FkbM family methyltransferase
MPETSISRRMINHANYFLGLAKMQLLSTTELEYLKNKPMLERLIVESRHTAIEGTLCAFTGYLAMRSDRKNAREMPSTFAGHASRLDTLSEMILDISENFDEPIDHFMNYYARHNKVSNSQWSQDVFVSYMLHGKKEGIFLEIGGADGITHSNTWCLQNNYGWRGTLVEPHPIQYQLLQMNRGNRRNNLLNCAVTPDSLSGTVKLTDAWQLSALENLSGKDLHENSRASSCKTYIVKSIPIQSVMESCSNIDYFSLDVEGPEYDLLSSIDWRRISKPSLITVEHNWRTDIIKNIRELLKKQGYTEYFPDHQWLTRGDLWFSNL